MRKYLLRTLAFAAVICLLLTVSVFAEDGVVTGNEVNFRSGPGTDYAIIDCLPKGTVVKVNDRSNSEWYSVTYNGQSGFIYAAYLEISDSGDDTAVTTEPDEPVQTAESGEGKINAMYVRLRSGPGTDYSILGEYNTGSVVTITGSEDAWYAVTVNGQNGYIYASYVTLSDGSTVPAVTPEPTTAPEPTPEPTEEPTVTPTGDTGIEGHISGDYVYFRSGPGTTYSIYDFLEEGTKITITGYTDDWTAVIINGQAGYVYSAYVVSDGNGAALPEPTPTPEPTEEPQSDDAFTPVDGYITGNNVRLRSEPSTLSDILGEYNYGAVLTITGRSGDWYAVTIGGKSGYIYAQYVSEGSVTTIGDDTDVSELGRQIVEYALQFEGCPYVWGGTTPDGFDCSGFTSYVYSHFGIKLHRVACDQATDGEAVDLNALQPGDLLCFYSSANYIGHVGIYIGNNKFIHASTYTTGVIISDLSGNYETRGFVARRVI